MYAASVVFPTAGTWDYEVNDGFVGGEKGQTWDCSTTHTFEAVTIGGAGFLRGPRPAIPLPPRLRSEPVSDGGVASLAIALLGSAAAVALAAALGIGLARRSARRHAGA